MALSPKAASYLDDLIVTEFNKLVVYLEDEPEEFVEAAKLLDEVVNLSGIEGDSYARRAREIIRDREEAAARPPSIHLWEYLDGGGLFRNGARVDIALHSQYDPPNVFWSDPGFNSYVLVRRDDGVWLTPDGQSCDLVSVNGRGEVRWMVDSTYAGMGEGSVDHFKLTRKD